MEKKKKIILIVSAILVALVIGGYTLKAKEDVFNSTKTSKDEMKFKEEYESLNGQEIDGAQYAYMELSIPTDNKMVYASKDEVLDLLENGTGILYFGFPECPWCRNIVPTLVNAAKEENIKEIYYYNAREDRDEKEFQNGKIVEIKKGNDFYYKVLEELGDKASVYDGLSDENEKRLYFPTVLFIKEGDIVKMHEGSVESQTDPFVSLTETQKENLKNIYVDGILQIYDEVCDDKC